MTIQMVVAKYRENCDWTKIYGNCVVIYDKSASDGTLPNVGRESHTYYNHISQNYDCLADYTIFLQGNPFDHSPRFLTQNLLFYFEVATATATAKDLSFQYLSEFVLPTTLEKEATKYPQCRQIFQTYQRVFGYAPLPHQCIQFGVGAQFIVSKERILARPREFYSNIVNMLSYSVDPDEGYDMERFHGLIFGDVSPSCQRSFYDIGLGTGTDKIVSHGYHRFFAPVLEQFRNQSNVGVLEIGIQHLNSVNLWLEYFPQSFVYGLDIGIEKTGDRYKIIKCDQSRRDQIMSAMDQIRHPIRFINDDGSHIPEDQMLTFDILFGTVLESGGVYIIEDIETSYWRRGGLYGRPTKYGYLHPKSLIECFKKMVDYCNHYYLCETDRAAMEAATSFFSRETKQKIATIQFCQNCIIIVKKTDEDLVWERGSYAFREFVG